MIFSTNRLIAKELDEENKKLLIELYSKEHNKKFLKGLNASQDIKLTFDSYLENKIGSYLIFNKDGSEFIGFGGVQNQEPLKNGKFAFDDKIEFLIIVDLLHSGKGYAYEFSLGFFKFFFEKFPDKIIPARVSTSNDSCLKLLKKIGFQDHGTTCYHDYDNIFYLLKIGKDNFVNASNYTKSHL